MTTYHLDLAHSINLCIYEGLNVILSVTGTVMEGDGIVELTLKTSNTVSADTTVTVEFTDDTACKSIALCS